MAEANGRVAKICRSTHTFRSLSRQSDNCCGVHRGPRVERGISWLFRAHNGFLRKQSQRHVIICPREVAVAMKPLKGHQRGGPSSEQRNKTSEVQRQLTDKNLDGRPDSTHFPQCMRRLSCSISGAR
ncbi:hypothetical protein T10_1475 [Trichinella papuae]|uniref:Uncharacterized protein n=1 Tax=Trichinella papuae TaxID=268474 RepID=A0A0V1M5Z7_9BILA|nr:hypothetical protein T10_1475 [Trichinella papuae]